MYGCTLTSLPFGDGLLSSIDLSVCPLSVISLTSSYPTQAGLGKTGQIKVGFVNLYIYNTYMCLLDRAAGDPLRSVDVSYQITFTMKKKEHQINSKTIQHKKNYI